MLKGRLLSVECKERIRASLLAYWSNPERRREQSKRSIAFMSNPEHREEVSRRA